jgi:MoaA/NifB/PqqE/SkfB family radical SAM enzyme
MAPELLARIVAKARSECEVAGISLFSWGEPLLHPRLPEMVEIVNVAGLPCHLSSNLNLRHDPDAIMAADPATFKISLSGFTQEIYGYSHRGGDIARVKRHMTELVAAKQRQRASTRIFVQYHRYRHNLQDEGRLREFAEDLGIDFEPVWALFFPLEKIIGSPDGEGSPQLTAEDRQLIDTLALPFAKALERAEQCGVQSCTLQETEISIDAQGNVQLCCGIFDAGRFTLGNYLDLSLEEIQDIRKGHPMCNCCLRQSAHLYLTYRLPIMEELVLANLTPEEAALLDLPSEIARKRLHRRLSRVYDTLFGPFLPAEQKAVLAGRFLQLQSFFSRRR